MICLTKLEPESNYLLVTAAALSLNDKENINRSVVTTSFNFKREFLKLTEISTHIAKLSS